MVLVALIGIVGIPACIGGYLLFAEAALGRLSVRGQTILRPWLWLGPALAFLSAFLIYPTLNTVYLSMLGARSTEFVGLQNYVFALTNGGMRAALKNNLLWHTTASWDRWVMSGSPLASGLDWADRLWGTDKSGIIDKTAGPPNITFTGNIPYTQLGMQWIGFGFEAINRWQFENDLTWVKGKHSIKIGDEFRLHRFNFHGWAASTGLLRPSFAPALRAPVEIGLDQGSTLSVR